MRALFDQFKHFARDESGATAIEYAIILGLMTIGIIAAISSVGDATRASYDTVTDAWQVSE